MSEVKLVKAANRRFKDLGGDAGTVKVCRDVDTDISNTMACGVVILEDVSMPWTVLYDEYFYCLEGTATIKTKGGDYVLEPGDGIWLPDGTELVYEAQGQAKLVVAVYPANWREIHGMT